MALFRRVPLADAVVRADALPAEAAAYQRDEVTLGWEERVRARARRASDEGFEFATTLPRGLVLRDGDTFVLPADHRVIVVREREEPVFVLTPSSRDEWALWAYHIGNSHQPMMIAGDAIVCPDVPGMEQVLDYHRIPFLRSTRAFTPVSTGPGHHGGPLA
ncbi:MAG: hypothetical protein AB7Q29_02565 [Vicinamibacterales bacterium]